MEVHQHTHTPRKKWTHYFWEFIMLFLAVFCGFLAENLREHTLEHKREKQYIASLVRDVELDVASLKLSQTIKKGYCNLFDSLVTLLRKNNPGSRNDIYYYARHLGRITEFKYHNRTIQELKNTGSLRLIRDKKVADSITVYDNEIVQVVLNQQQIEHLLRIDILSNQVGRIFNGYTWNDMVDELGRISRISNNPELVTRDQNLINDFIVHVVHLKTSYRLTNGEIEAAIKAAGNLIAFLKKEYHLE